MGLRWSVLLALVALLACAPPAAAGGPDGLTTEYAENPLGLDVAHPRLAWRSPVETQVAYQIRVAASGRTVWDSGKVRSAASAQVSYAGPDLRSRTRYHWRVRVWDAAGRVSRWSDSAWWEMGPLEASDWRADWIGGRQELDHDWADQKVTFDFTLTGPSLNFLFRAQPVGKTWGETYNWEVTTVDGRPTLREQVRHYRFDPANPFQLTTLTTLKEVTIPALQGERHRIAIDAQGTEIRTYLDDALVDTLVDDSQRSGTIGVRATSPDAAVIHEVSVESGGRTVFYEDFADNHNPFNGGDPVEGRLAVPAARSNFKDIVLPIQNPAQLLRREFDAGRGGVRGARLYVAAGGWPDVTLNGEQVSRAALENGFTAYHKRVLYRTYDVTDLVRPGRNTLAAELGHGWYGMNDPNEWYWHVAPWHGNPALKAQLELTYADGRREIVATDGSWRAADGPTTFDTMYTGDWYDARRRALEDWRPAEVVDGPAGRLQAAQLDPIEPVETVRPVSVTEPRPGVWVFDFGRIFAGWVELNVTGPRGRQVSLIHTEKLRPDGTVDSDQRLIDAQIQTDKYTLAGGGPERWEPSFSYKGFRYVQVEGHPGRPSLDTVLGKVVHSSVRSTGTFTSSNELINKIHQAARTTLLNNTHGFVTDTPTYEKNGWTGDAQASAHAAALNFGMGRTWTKWLTDFEDAQSAKGEIPEIVPAVPEYGYESTPGWNFIWGPTPSWDAATFILPWEQYLTYGDTRILERMYETQKRLVDYTGTYINQANDFTYDRGLGEYQAAPGRGGPTDATAVAHYYLMVDRLAESARLLGRDADAATYRQLAVQLRESYNQRYWDAKGEIYRTLNPDGTAQPYSQTQNILPVAFGMAPDDAEAAVVKSINDDLVAQGYHFTAGVYGIRYAMTMLSDHGYADTAYRVATQTSEPSWGWWIVNGHSTMFEGWSLSSRSYDHHYFGSISSWFYEGLAGIRPGGPGYRSVLIKPHVPAGLDRAAGAIDTLRGRVASSWSRYGRHLELRVRIPGNTPAEVAVPTGTGKPVDAPRAARFVRSEEGYAVYRIPPGTHTFRSIP